MHLELYGLNLDMILLISLESPLLLLLKAARTIEKLDRRRPITLFKSITSENIPLIETDVIFDLSNFFCEIYKTTPLLRLGHFDTI